MAFDPQNRATAYSGGRAVDRAEIDEGLRRYMLRVYNYMALGVAFTGAVSLIVATNEQLLFTIAATPLKWVLFAGIIGMGFLAPRLMTGGSTVTAQLCFWVYAGMWGALIGPMLYAYNMAGMSDLIAKAFFITTGAFAALSLFGYTTKKNLGPMGAFLCMATFGLLIAMLVNVFFIQSAGFDLVVTLGVIVVFSGLTAYETQQIKNWYYQTDGTAVQSQMAIFGAFMLYGSFVTLFIWILHLLGIMRD